jgi:hypothetical protein
LSIGVEVIQRPVKFVQHGPAEAAPGQIEIGAMSQQKVARLRNSAAEP